MKLATFIHGLIAWSSTVLFFCPAQAQAISPADPAPITRYDQVQADLSTIADANSVLAFHRTATLATDSSYRVVITFADGTLRMTGRYLDPALTIPDGTFTYYYPNGEMESTGAYAHGVKTGIWSRATPEGKPRAERVYRGLDWDHLQFLVGTTELAATINAEVPADREGSVQ